MARIMQCNCLIKLMQILNIMKTTEKNYSPRYTNFEYIGFASIAVLLFTIVIGFIAY